MAENRVIGRDGVVPWDLPADMRYFRTVTTGHTVIMGRKTFESLVGPLKERHNVVVTRRGDWSADGVTVAHSLEEALAAAEGEAEVFVAGGAEIYEQALPVADRIYLTVVHRTIEGDTCFPEFDADEWELVRDDKHELFSFRLYERRAKR